MLALRFILPNKMNVAAAYSCLVALHEYIAAHFVAQSSVSKCLGRQPKLL